MGALQLSARVHRVPLSYSAEQRKLGDSRLEGRAVNDDDEPSYWKSHLEFRLAVLNHPVFQRG